jgi:septal ring factor EnvC (AmiA/AmiB activator)
MPAFDINVFAVLGLFLAFLMTLVALVSYWHFEVAKKHLAQREEELRTIKSETSEFRQKTAGAFVDQKSLKLRIETLERSLALANEQLDMQRQESERLRTDIKQLRAEYDTTKANLTDAYKRLRDKP